MRTVTYPDFPHLTIEIDGESRTSTERCSRCGASETFDMVRACLNAINASNGGSSFMNQHRLPNCGANGIRDLVANSAIINELKQPCTEAR